MKSFWPGAALALLVVPSLRGDEPLSAAPKTFEVPYRLTIPKHVLVRAKINGKGPYNFILDTGAPALFIAEKLGEKLDIKPDRTHWGTLDRFEIEGGVVLEKAKARIETPFQLEGMNGMGLAGAELHGIIGYNVLARYRMEIDFSRDKMTWTALDFEPKAPAGLGGRAGAAGGLEVIGSIMKMLGSFLGRKATPDVMPRGFLGLELKDSDEGPVVKTVLEGGPAGKAGLKVGDRINKFAGRTVIDAEDVERFARKVVVGLTVKIAATRGRDVVEVNVTAGEGF